MSIFRYALIEDIKNENVSQSDDRINTFIDIASRYINRITDQFFVPVREIQVLDGTGSSKIYLHSRIPIQKIHSLKIDGSVISSSRYEVSGRASDRRRELFLKNPAGSEPIKFDDGMNNIRVDAVLGWLEPRFDPPLEIEVTQDASFNDTSVQVDDTSRLEKHFIPSTEKETLPLVSEVDDANNAINFDVPINTEVSSGDILTFYGEVPAPIVQATKQIVTESIDPLSVDSGQELTGSPSFQSRLVEEQTDNYRYRLDSGVPQGVIERGDLTSSVYSLLKQYTLGQFFRASSV